MLSPAPKPDEETKYSAEGGLNPGRYLFLCRPASRTDECWCFTKPFQRDGSLILHCLDSVGWSSLLTSWLAIATRHLMSPQRVPPQNVLHRHSCCDVPLDEVSHSCVVTGDKRIMSPSHSCCCTNCVACFSSIIQ